LNGATIVQIVEQGEGNYRFVPASLTVKAGTVVVWVNGTDTMHTVISKTGAPGPFSTTGMLAPAQTFAVLFSAPGTYPYQCSIHPTTMQATITVTS
jgi:plastocyanin